MIPRGDYTIDADGVYVLASDYSGTITVNAKNVKIMQANSSLPLRNVFIVGSKNFIKFQGEGNRLNIIGKNKFNDEGRGTRRTAVINIGGGLTVAANSDPKAQIDFTANYENHYYHGALIGSDEDEDLSSSNITIYGGTFTSDITRDVAGMIGGGGNAGDITIQNDRNEIHHGDK